MEKYIKPELIEETLELEDIIAASTQDSVGVDALEKSNADDFFIG